MGAGQAQDGGTTHPGGAQSNAVGADGTAHSHLSRSESSNLSGRLRLG